MFHVGIQKYNESTLKLCFKPLNMENVETFIQTCRMTKKMHGILLLPGLCPSILRHLDLRTFSKIVSMVGCTVRCLNKKETKETLCP
jgi:hypothetical protein